MGYPWHVTFLCFFFFLNSLDLYLEDDLSSGSLMSFWEGNILEAPSLNLLLTLS